MCTLYSYFAFTRVTIAQNNDLVAAQGYCSNFPDKRRVESSMNHICDVLFHRDERRTGSVVC